ncbi:hypothetical protein Drose_26830 [Dactylosporangium roseum]|uniref:Beta-ketoacyl synthase N-terminal domain-containing protein n=1 Tax=Dactylosporangium roseum TaxID=47989 RepID=A0ABY5YYG5_9ACTN|nr:hypothetical protein [Dactylosporangium roseum]UWZ34790.1 hypothetical protein Drose_26830 [Dactylosporangium roseum]
MNLGLRAAAVTVAPAGRPYHDDPQVAEFNQDLAAAFGLGVEEELLRAGRNLTHADLVDLLVAELPAGLPAPDLVVLARVLPDLNQYKTVASYLNLRTGGRAHSFAIAGQGLGAPFLALRVALAYARSGRSRSSMIAVLEQTTLPFRDGVVHGGVPLVDSGVLLCLDAGAGPWRPTSVVEFGTGEDPNTGLKTLADTADAPLAVMGPWLAGSDQGDPEVHRVAPGGYGTSVWLALAREAERWAADHDALLLCDTDPRTGVTHVARFDRCAPQPEMPAVVDTLEA